MDEQLALLDKQCNWLDEKKKVLYESRRIFLNNVKQGLFNEKYKNWKQKELLKQELKYDEWTNELNKKRRQLVDLRKGKRIRSRNDDKKYKEDIEKISEKQDETKQDIYSMNNLCENALMEYTYCKVLLESNDNQTLNCFAIPQGRRQKHHRHMALNIRNTIRYVNAIQDVNQNRFQRLSIWRFEEVKRLEKEAQDILTRLEKADVENKSMASLSLKMGRSSLILGLLSIVLGLLSIALGAISFVLGIRFELIVTLFVLGGLGVFAFVCILLVKILKSIWK